MGKFVFSVALLGLVTVAVAQEGPTSRPTSQPAVKEGAKKQPAKTLSGDEFPALGNPAGVYGAGVDLPTGLSLGKAAQQVKALAGKPIRLTGKVQDVCKKKGCWVVLHDGDTSVRAKFLDYAFFVPRDCDGREILLQGVITEKTISEEEAKHYASEGGDPEAAKAIKGPQTVTAFMATGAEILGRRELPPVAKPAAPAQATALLAKLATAKQVTAVKAVAKSPTQALRLLRSVRGPRSVEFSLCAEVSGWYVFSAQNGKAFEGGFAVKAGTGEIYSY